MATTEVQAALDADAELSKPMQIADSVFALTLSDDVVSSSEKADIQKQLMEDISARAMTPFYIKLCDKLGWTKDEALIAKLTAENEKELKDLDAKIEDATANLGQNEVMDFVIEKANMFARIGEHQDKVAEAYTEIPEKSSSKGQKIDVVLHLIRVAFFHNDLPSVKKHLENAKRLVEGGGDWDRRNRLKVYEATYLMTMREFAKAADLLLDSIATFTSLEMFSYRDLIFYTVMMSVFSLDRVALKAKVIDSPDVLSLILEIPHLSEYLNALQDCQYRGFFQAMADMHPSIMRNRYLSKHAAYYVREMRVRAYTQFLDAYLSVTVDSMAESFGVSAAFLDKELSTFIASSRLNAKIDLLDGVIMTNRPDARTASYSSVLKHGDVLLNRIQRLARVVTL